MSDKKTLATFKIDESAWDAFKKKCETVGNSASYELQQFVFSYIGRTDRAIATHHADIESSIDSYLESNLQGMIDKRLESMLDSVLDNYLSSRLDGLLDEKIGEYRKITDNRIDGLEEANLALLVK